MFSRSQYGPDGQRNVPTKYFWSDPYDFSFCVIDDLIVHEWHKGSLDASLAVTPETIFCSATLFF